MSSFYINNVLRLSYRVRDGNGDMAGMEEKEELQKMELAELRHGFAGNETGKMPSCYGCRRFHTTDFCQFFDVISMVYLTGKINIMQAGLACQRKKEGNFSGKK